MGIKRSIPTHGAIRPGHQHPQANAGNLWEEGVQAVGPDEVYGLIVDREKADQIYYRGGTPVFRYQVRATRTGDSVPQLGNNFRRLLPQCSLPFCCGFMMKKYNTTKTYQRAKEQGSHSREWP